MVSGSSNTVVDSEVFLSGGGIAVEAGASGTVIANNLVTRNFFGTGIDNVDADGTAVTGNTVAGNCTGITVRGTSAGVSVMNNIVVRDQGSAGCATPVSDRVDIGVTGAATSSATVDDNIVHQGTSGEDLYAWDTPIASLAEFRTASGQGAHDIDADPMLASNLVPQPGSPAIDSADAAAPGEQATDYDNRQHVDDPDVPDTGRGPVTYHDRGAYELHEAISAVLKVTTASPKTPWKFVADASGSLRSWSTGLSYAFDFGDGTTLVGSAPVATHSYTRRGTFTVTVAVSDPAELTSTASQPVTVTAVVVGGPMPGLVPAGSPVRR